MSTLKVDNITDELGTGAPNFSNGLALSGTPLSGVASEAESEAGTDNTKLMTPLGVEQHTLANDLGWGQIWQNVLSSRAANVSFQNTTGAPIYVYIDCGDSTQFRDVESSPDNLSWTVVSAIAGGAKFNAAFIVPDTWYYRIKGTQTPVRWAELR